MAIGVGSIVAMNPATAAGGALPDTAFGPPIQQQPPQFGKVDDDGPPLVVLWGATGTLTSLATDDTLDEILPPDAGVVTALAGKLVELLPSALPSSPEYQGTVISLFIRDPGNGEPTTTTRALVRTNAGWYYEIAADQLQAVSGR